MNSKRLFRTLASLVVITALFAVLTDGSADDQNAASDPLTKTLEELRQQIDLLRGEIRDIRTEPENPAMKPTPAKLPAPISKPSVTSVPKQAPKALPEMAIAPASSDHWSFQPIQPPALPATKNEDWVRRDLDRFILAKLEDAKLKPNPDADRYTLIRRISFDLTGLPPTESEILEFVNDKSPLDEALASVVDRYLASPRFGERWGRHWLDIVRYADSVGRNWNAPFTYAWRYRDYVIDAFNKDVPYDRFIAEQLAGDLLPFDDQAKRRENLVATGFLALGAMDIIEPEGESLMMDRIDEQIDVTTRAMLGLTVACARCHDHKYEPVSMWDYYAMAGIFYSTDTRSGQRRGNYVADDDLILLPASDGRKTIVPGVHSMADMTREHRSVEGYREVLWTTDPNLAMAALEGEARDCPIRIDGEAYKQGAVPPRGDFRIGGLSGLKDIRAGESGRLELARWIASPRNPLTARVMVNRVWLHLFGRGLVETVDNFGVSGGSPTHPELLDHLATGFAKTWSFKSLIRDIMLSRAYRLGSEGQKLGQMADAQNQLYWRMNPRRLELEAVRDSMLSASGRLTFRRPEGIQVAGTGGKGRWGSTRSLIDIDAPYRTVYLPVLRSLLPEMYSTFDFPNPTQIQGQREVTTVAPQALFLMNSEFASGAAAGMANRVLDEPHKTDADRIRVIYLRLYSRLPVADEVEAGRSFLNDLSGRDSELYRWSALIQALMIGGEFRTLL